MKELREKIARQVQAMQDFLKQHTETWSAENETEYGKMNDELANLQSQMQRMERQESLAVMAREYQTVVNPVNQPGAEGHSPMESFAAYTRHDAGLSDEQIRAGRSLYAECFDAYIKRGERGLEMLARKRGFGPAEIQALLSTDNTLGGFLVFDEIRSEILMAEKGYAVLANLCRVEPTNSNALVFPKVVPHSSDVRRSSGFTGQWQNEGYVTGGTAPTVQNQPTFAQERIPVYSWQPDAIEVGKELLEDTGANLRSIIGNVIAECLAFDKDDKIFNGGGAANNEPEGIMQAGISTVNSGGATSITIGGIIGTFSEVPAQYRNRASWVMHSRTMGAILQLNTGTGGVYLFPPNQWNNTILGRPVVFLDYGMDTATAAGGTTFTAGEYPMIFGDFSKYIIAQRQELAIQYLTERFAPNTGILPTARLGGQVVLTDAFRIMTVAA